MTHPAMQQHFDPVGILPLPAAEAPAAEIEEFIRKNAQTTWHYSCTAPMGTGPHSVCRLAISHEWRSSC